MIENELTFGCWRKTRQVYSTIEAGHSDKCDCNNCVEFPRMRDSFYTSELRQLFDTLGIDYRKEAEVYSAPGQGPPWIGWFHFVGKVSSGEVEMQYLNGDFQIEVSSYPAAPQPEFAGLSIVRLEWQWPAKDLRRT